MSARSLIYLLGLFVPACEHGAADADREADLTTVPGDDVRVRLFVWMGLPADVYDTVAIDLDGERMALTEVDPTAAWDLDAPEAAHDAEELHQRRGGYALVEWSLPRAIIERDGLPARVVDAVTGTTLAETTFSAAACPDVDSILIGLEESASVVYAPECGAWLIGVTTMNCRFSDPEDDYGVDGLLGAPSCA